MSHPFGDRISQHLHRKHGLSQSKLAAGILQAPTIITKMCKGQRLTGPQARERVVAIIGWLHGQGALDTVAEANALLDAAGMSALREGEPAEAVLMKQLPTAPATQIFHPATNEPRSNLPAVLTTFIGRENEIAELVAQVQTTRLLTLLGSGGVGKSRLALEVAHAVVGTFANGVWLIELAPLSDPTLVPQTVLRALKLPEQAGQAPLDVLIGHLETKHLLLILDNCEHLIGACAALVEALVQRCPQLHVLATSRERLRVAGEVTHRVPSLTTPHDKMSPVDLLRYEAIRLFRERASTAQFTFAWSASNAAAVATICNRLDGIPLAIELATARLNVFTPQQIAERLNDRFSLLVSGSRTALPRHQTLRAAIAWSYDLLSPAEQTLLMRLSVFAGGFTAEAAEFVSGQPEAMTLLSNLVDKSLVIAEVKDKAMRYHLLETIRQFAHDRLEESGEADEVRQCHAAFFVELAERVEPSMSGDQRKVHYAQLDAEQDNCRAVLGWALATHHAELGLRLAGALGDYWFWWASRWVEGWSWISQLLALPEAAQPKQARANVLRAAVNLLKHLGDPAEANRLAEESLALSRELGDKMGMAWVLADKGCYAWDRADYSEAVILCDEGAALFREVGDQRGLAWALLWRAGVARDCGQYDEAAVLFDESVAAARTIGDNAIVGNVYRLLGELAYDTGDYARADVIVRQGISLCQEGGDTDGANYTLACLARITLAKGDLAGAASQFEASEAWFRQTRQENGLTDVLSHLGYVRHLQGKPAEAIALLREAIALQWQQQLRRKLIQSLERCAWIAGDLHQSHRAVRLFGATEAAREWIGAPLPPGDKPLYDRHLTQVRADLDEPAFDVAWAEGRAMTLDQAVEYALAELETRDLAAQRSSHKESTARRAG